MTTPSRSKSVLLFGAPGVGKGTQGKILAAIPGCFHLSTGDMFRGLDPLSDLGKVFREYSVKGELVPDSFTVELWKQHVESLKSRGAYRPATDLLILDGIPRSAAQASLMEPLIDVLAVIHLDARDRDEMVRRLRLRAQREQRADDAKEEVIRRRLDVYDAETKPVLSRYPADRVHLVNAMGQPATVLRDILNILAPLQAAHFGNALA